MSDQKHGAQKRIDRAISDLAKILILSDEELGEKCSEVIVKIRAVINRLTDEEETPPPTDPNVPTPQ